MPVNEVVNNPVAVNTAAKYNKPLNKPVANADNQNDLQGKKTGMAGVAPEGSDSVNISRQAVLKAKNSAPDANREEQPRQETQGSRNIESLRAVQAYRNAEAANKPATAGRQTISRMVGA